MSVIDPRPTQMREATAEDFLNDAGLGKTRLDLGIAHYLMLNSRYPLPKNNAWLQKHNPVLNKIINSETLTPEDEVKLKEQMHQFFEDLIKDKNPNSVAQARLKLRPMIQSSSHLGQYLLEKFSPEIEHLKKELHTMIVDAVKRGYRSTQNGVNLLDLNFDYGSHHGPL